MRLLYESKVEVHGALPGFTHTQLWWLHEEIHKQKHKGTGRPSQDSHTPSCGGCTRRSTSRSTRAQADPPRIHTHPAVVVARGDPQAEAQGHRQTLPGAPKSVAPASTPTRPRP